MVVEKIKTHILRSIIFFRKRAVFDVTWENLAEPDRPQVTI